MTPMVVHVQSSLYFLGGAALCGMGVCAHFVQGQGSGTVCGCAFWKILSFFSRWILRFFKYLVPIIEFSPDDSHTSFVGLFWEWCTDFWPALWAHRSAKGQGYIYWCHICGCLAFCGLCVSAHFVALCTWWEMGVGFCAAWCGAAGEEQWCNVFVLQYPVFVI